MPTKTPAVLGYRMPAEWEPHAATWLAWPHNPETWPGKMGPIPGIYARLIKALTAGEDVQLCVNDAAMKETARRVLAEHDALSDRVHFHHFPTNDTWARDHGPIFVRREDGRLAVTDWEFNMWGGKYPPWELDNQIPRRVAEFLKLERFAPGIVLEGGSIDGNGRGTVLTTEQCLLNKNRNPHLSRAQLEKYLEDYLGVRKVLWLGDGIEGDDTDGHIDDLARFVGPHTVVTVTEENKHDANYEPLRQNLHRLRQLTDQDGHELNVIELPMPRPIFYEDRRLPASYANFYIGNAVVVVPTFNDPNDARALEILARCFPGRRILGLEATDLVWGLGAFHCITQQQPA